MTLSTFDCIAAITEHSAGFAEAARAVDLGTRVEYCPDWTVADLVWHLTEVHWFWATIAEVRPTSRPGELPRPPRSSDGDLVDAFVAGATRLVEVLRNADQSAPCWTWAPKQQDVAFITRHQVQEAAVHHWDVVHAGGGTLVLPGSVAADSVDEFLAFSVSNAADPDDPDPEDPALPALDGTFALRTPEAAWTLTDGPMPGTVAVQGGVPDGVPAVDAGASDLILWLYGRTDLDTSAVPGDLVARFKALCFAD